MNQKRSFIKGLFEPLTTNTTRDSASHLGAKNIWLWWEKRRLSYNIIVILTAGSVVAVFLLISAVWSLLPHEAVESNKGGSYIAVIFFVVLGPIIWNSAYCLGTILDLLLFSLNKRRHSGPLFLQMGIVFSISLIWALPAVLLSYWALRGFPVN